jgi:hypothetical protein
VPQGFFSTLNPFMHSKMQFKQQKIAILSKFTSPDSDQKTQKIERLANWWKEGQHITIEGNKNVEEFWISWRNFGHSYLSNALHVMN